MHYAVVHAIGYAKRGDKGDEWRGGRGAWVICEICGNKNLFVISCSCNIGSEGKHGNGFLNEGAFPRTRLRERLHCFASEMD